MRSIPISRGAIDTAPLITCRYCPFYAPDALTPLKGHCAYYVPPRFIELPFKPCPLINDPWRIDKAASGRGFSDHFLKRVVFQTYYSDGLPTRYYKTVDALKKDNPRADRIIALYVDADNRIFYRVAVPADGGEHDLNSI